MCRRRDRALRAAALLLLAAGALLGAKGVWIPAKAQLAQLLLERAWARERAGAAAVRPWPWADTYPVARLRAPAQGCDLIVLAGGSGRTLAFGPGHLTGSAPPGTIGNTVIAGHRDTNFAFLERLATGDLLELETTAGRRLRYRVTATAVVDQGRMDLAAPSGEALLTLVTCYPFRALLPGGPRRYVVRAVAVGDGG